MCLLYFLLCVTAKCFVSYICIEVAIYFGKSKCEEQVCLLGAMISTKPAHHHQLCHPMYIVTLCPFAVS